VVGVISFDTSPVLECGTAPHVAGTVATRLHAAGSRIADLAGDVEIISTDQTWKDLPKVHRVSPMITA